MMSRGHPGHLPAPIVTNEMNARGTDGIDDIEHIVNKPLGAVCRNIGGSNARRVPALVKRYSVKACSEEHRKRQAPGVAGLRKPVQQDDAPSVSGPDRVGTEPSLARHELDRLNAHAHPAILVICVAVCSGRTHRARPNADLD
jgi:hypothetical protein